MKLRALALENVRRFAGQVAEIEGIGDGITVIDAPNEFGKTTFFDALHALFFQPHGSRHREVRSLQPDPGGGGVGVRADVETAEGLFRVEKTFLSKAMARVSDLRSGRVIAQADEAERWITALLGDGKAGPAGLLWVRQGVTGLEDGKGDGLTARRDLLSSVAGEIDLMTGGRRMDRVMAACQAALDRQVTGTDRPRAGGPLKEALDEVEALEAEVAGLQAQSARLAAALEDLGRTRAALARLTRPEAEAALLAAAQAAEAALKAGEDRATQLAEARQRAELARLQHHAAEAAFTTLSQAIEAARGAADRARGAAAGAERLAAELAEARAGEAAAEAARDKAARHVAEAAEALQRASRRASAREAAAVLARQEEALLAAEAQQAVLAAAEATLSLTQATEAGLTRIEQALAAEAAARARAEAQAVRLTLRYSGAERITAEDGPLPEGDSALTRRMRLDLPGIGQMTIDPGAAGDGAARAGLEKAAAELRAALEACGAETVEEARAALSDRKEAEGAARLARAMLGTLAPEGIAALRAALDRTRARAAVEGGETRGGEAEEDAATLALAHEAALAAEAQARAAFEALRAGVLDLTGRAAAARAEARQAEEAAAAAEAAAGRSDTREARLATAEAEWMRMREAQTAAGIAADRLAETVPDLETLRAEKARAESALAAARSEIASLREARARLEGEIRAQADLGLSEALEEAEGRLAAARERGERLRAEVAALLRLREVLQGTRAAAREAYFGPVQEELAPLLAILHANAALDFDPDTLLPGRLARAGAEESLSRLSGGTQEQIAILTRLAFARLFARSGRPVPVILDDALVHSDDDRIVRMFTALHRVAADQQVIVLTCRQMAFAALGGARPGVRIGPAG